MNREQTFLQALQAFDTAKTPDDYRRVASMWESLIADGYHNGSVYYNLGNAYYRAGEYGRAILNYRKAKALRPRDSYLEANLQQALSMASGRLPEAPVPWWSHIFFWQDWIAYPTKLKAASVAFCIAPIFAVLGVWFRRPAANWMSLICIVVSGFFAADAWLNPPIYLTGRHGVVVAETVARKGTGNDYEPAFDKPLQDGAEFEIIRESNGWVLGHFHQIGDGWVRKDDVAR